MPSAQARRVPEGVTAVQNDTTTLHNWVDEYAQWISSEWPAEDDKHRAMRAETFERERAEQIDIVQLIFNTCQLKAGAACLDVGPAFGFKPYLLFRIGMEQMALEHSGVDFGRPKQELFPYPILECDLAREPFPFSDASFDLVTTSGVVEHIPAPTSHFWRELVRVTKPGGRLFVHTPNGVSLKNRLLVLRGRTTGAQLPDWFDQPGGVFTGHWREHVLRDLAWISDQLQLRVVATGHTETFWSHAMYDARRNPFKRALLTAYRLVTRILPNSEDCIYAVLEKHPPQTMPSSR